MRQSKTSIRPYSCLASILLIASAAAGATPAEDFFEAKVRPVFAKNCYACHTAAQTSGLRVDSREALLKGGTRGPAIVPGKPEASLLVKAIHYSDSHLKMPPPNELAAEDVPRDRTVDSGWRAVARKSSRRSAGDHGAAARLLVIPETCEAGDSGQ